MDCFGGVRKKEHLRGTGPEWKKGIIGSVDSGKERPESVHLRDVAGEERQNIYNQCRPQTELDWPNEERCLLVEYIHVKMIE